MRDVTLEDTFYIDFTTRAITGVPTQLAGSPVLSVLEENNATPITAGVSVSVDRASVTGLNMATIVATAANGYEAGKGYSVYISTGTVNSVQAVGEVVGQFTIQANPVNWAKVTAPTTAVDLSATDIQLADTTTTLTNGATLAAGAITDASLAGAMEIVFETDFATNYNETDNAWVTNGTSFIGTGWNVAKTGYALTATTGLGAQTANITGNLSGSVGSVTGAVGSVTGAVGSVTGSVGSNLELGPAEVNAEVVDVLFTDTDAEPAQGLPAATTTLADKIGFLYKAWRNKSTQTATTYSLFNDDAATVDHKATVSDDATTATKGEVATGP